MLGKEILADRYVLNEIVGEGSYSVVFRGWDKVEDRTVAIKELKRSGLTVQEMHEAQDLFFREIKILKALDHPAFPKVYDFIYFRGRHYLIMEWITGENLLDMIERRGGISEATALKYMSQVTNALIYLQKDGRNIIYKDLKPSNIILTGRGKLKLIDFGAARFYSRKKNKDTHALGTPGYAPPEAYTGAQTDFSADIYSLGATFYHLVTGQEPFQFRFRFPSPRKFNRKLSTDFCVFISDCLKSREKRIPDAKTARKRLSGLIGWSDIDLDRIPQEWKRFIHFSFSVSVVAFMIIVVLFGITSGFLSTLIYMGSSSLIGFIIAVFGVIFPYFILRIGVGLFWKKLHYKINWIFFVISMLCFIWVCMGWHSGKYDPRADGYFMQCQANCKNIRIALEMYANDNNDHFPGKLDQLTPKYFRRSIPKCPTKRKDTYSKSYHTDAGHKSYTFYCSGKNHKAVGVTGNYPQYNSNSGLIRR